MGAFLQSRIAFGFRWPVETSDGLVDRLTATERPPEPIREPYGKSHPSVRVQLDDIANQGLRQ